MKTTLGTYLFVQNTSKMMTTLDNRKRRKRIRQRSLFYLNSKIWNDFGSCVNLLQFPAKKTSKYRKTKCRTVLGQFENMINSQQSTRLVVSLAAVIWAGPKLASPPTAARSNLGCKVLWAKISQTHVQNKPNSKIKAGTGPE